jgi:xanthine dehydrogenase/oxidase
VGCCHHLDLITCPGLELLQVGCTSPSASKRPLEIFAQRVIQSGEPIDDALAKAKHVFEGTVRMGGQEHFYLETGGSLVIPREDEYEVFSSCQNMRELQEHVAEVLGIPSNRVTARVKRLGGGFGGKETRPVHLAGCLAVAAQKTGQPIRCSLDRDEDIMTTGQRHPALAKYTVGVDDEGKLQALKLDCFVNGGYSLDISSGVLERMMAHADGPYKCPSTFIRGRICKTNTVCKSH